MLLKNWCDDAAIVKSWFKSVNENETDLLFFTTTVDHRENTTKLRKYFAYNWKNLLNRAIMYTQHAQTRCVLNYIFSTSVQKPSAIL